MKDKKVWDFSLCQIGNPCQKCKKQCTFRLDKGADEKEKENERITEKPQERIEQDFYRKWRNHLLQHDE